MASSSRCITTCIASLLLTTDICADLGVDLEYTIRLLLRVMTRSGQVSDRQNASLQAYPALMDYGIDGSQRTLRRLIPRCLWAKAGKKGAVRGPYNSALRYRSKGYVPYCE